MRALIVGVLLLGCGNKPSPDAVNALVDQAKNPKLHFIERDVTINKGRDYQRTFAVIVPDNWVWGAQDEEFYVDPKDHGAGNIAFRSSCYSAPCILGDFKSIIEKDLADQIKILSANVLENKSTPNERKWVTKDAAGLIAIARFWWSGETPTEYFSCWVVTPEALEPSRAAFEKACDLAVVQK
ncbi:MAG TPA: hypothetical protein VFQ65_32100 [Kofleriaceae bacterium]|nr:hypothetical protein [Kofleriaceae bacterium]